MKLMALLLCSLIYMYANDASQELVDLGCKYLSNKDYANAKKVFEEATYQGNADAMHNLGLMYINADGVVQNYQKALFYFQKAFDHKRINSAYDIGVMYRNGEGVTKDLFKSKEYYLIAANNNYALAQFELSKLYGLEQNMTQFQYWTEKAIHNGYIPKTEKDKQILIYLNSMKK